MGNIYKFNLPTNPPIEQNKIINIPTMPTLNSKVGSSKYNTFILLKEISSGGEGVIYSTTIPSLVCKIYHKDKLTISRKNKIELMITRRIQTAGICWPVDFVTFNGVFVGYLMPFAQGKPIQTTVFTKPALLRNFPSWNRGDLADLAISFTEKINVLHSYNIIVGDINPLNVLVDKDKNLYFVDTDSYQVENFPCPVGTINFTAPEIQGRDYGKFLRTKEHEFFAVATMIFMILFPGKSPYSQQGGGMPGENIRNKNFPYRCDNESDGIPPEGSWGFIWANLTKNLRKAFCETFRQDNRKTPDEWKKLLQGYAWAIGKGYISDELFPLTYKIIDPIDAKCGECGSNEIASKPWIRKLQSQNKSFLCGQCRKKIRLQKLVKISLQEQKKIATPPYNKPTSTNYKQSTRPSYNYNIQHQSTIPAHQQRAPQNYNTNNSNANISHPKKPNAYRKIINFTFFPLKISYYIVRELIESALYFLAVGFHAAVIIFAIFIVSALLKNYL
ncbi:MAG: hypothetical protein IBX45_11100 [Campylobacterales bacterium]|nr:hypothetical protein [Campylobacterales bacterium]